ncbi:MAG: HsdR family type I site-specific deoxyribonuclease [Candidatus Bathyarchaeia archaeon]
MPLAERTLQNYIGRRLKEDLGWEVVEWGKGAKGERDSLEEVIIKERLFKTIEGINNVSLSDNEKKDIFSILSLLPNTIEGIKNFLDFAKNGIPFKIRINGKEIPKQIYLFDFENINNNDFFAVKEFEVEEEDRRRRFDLCLFVNGIPLVAIETKNPFLEEEKGTSWYDAYKQILEYEKAIPSIFKYIQFCIVSDGYETKHFPNYYAENYDDFLEKEKGVWKSFYPFKEEEVKSLKTFPYLDSTIFGLLSKRNLLDLIENFIFIKRYKDVYQKIMAWYMQFEATNLIVKRAVEEKEKLGLTWHWQGSGKTLTMAFASWKLLRNPKLEVPTIFIVVDRKDLQTQIVDEEFRPLGIEIEKIENIRELVNVLKWGGREREGKRGIFACLIQKFQPEKLKKLHDEGEINLERENIVIFTDESHRSQYGILANVMRGIFKNATIFGFTGTPLTKPERNTFQKFSPKGELYLHRYGMLNSIKDGFTIPIRYEARLPELHLKEEEIEELSEYEEEVIEELTPEERKLWRRKVRPRVALLKSPERIEKICRDIVEYFKAKIEKTGLKAMIACVDRESCVLIKRELDKHLNPKYSEIVMTYQARERSQIIEDYKNELVKRLGHSDFDKINRDIRDWFKDRDLPKILIVSDMLLTGFDAKRLWTLFLHKPLKEHRLLQAIARTNRPYKDVKEYGLIVDYIGIAKSLEKALQQFESEFINEALLIIRDVKASEKDFEKCVNEIKEMLEGVEIRGLEDIDKAVEVLVLNGREKEFNEKAKKLRILYELLSPSEATFKHLEFYKWVICISMALNRYRRIGMRLIEIERMAKKTYELIQKTVGIERIEGIGKVDIVEELSKLEAERKPRNALRVLGEITRSIEGFSSDFYVSLREEIERIVEEMREEKKLTKDVIESIRSLQERLKEREMEKKKLGEIFPVFDVLRRYFPNVEKIEKTSKEAIQELRERDLLSKESFLKKKLRKEIKRIVRESIIMNFGLMKELDEIVEKTFTNLEEEYG